MFDATNLPRLDTLQAFHHAASELSFKSAAVRLRITPSAISHRIKQLETELGVPLFHRLPRALQLTAEGAELARQLSGVFAGLAQAVNSVTSDTKAARLRISALPLFATAILVPRLPDFRRQHPGIDIHLDTRSDVIDLSDDTIDIGVRNMVTPPTGKGVSKLLDIRPTLLCAPALASSINSMDDLKHQTWIHCTPRPNGWADWLAVQGASHLTSRDDIWVDTIPAGLEAATLGQGVTIGMAPLVWRASAARELVIPFETDGRGGTSYYLVHRPEDSARPEVQAFKNWVHGEMGLLKSDPRPTRTQALAAD